MYNISIIMLAKKKVSTKKNGFLAADEVYKTFFGKYKINGMIVIIVS